MTTKTNNLRWISWNQHGDAEHEPDNRPVAWPPPAEVLAFWGTGSGDGYCTVVALVRADSEDAAVALIEEAWSPGIGKWRFNDACDSEKPPNDRFPPPHWSIAMGRWPWKDTAQ
jgi:hypothetical protein